MTFLARTNNTDDTLKRSMRIKYSGLESIMPVIMEKIDDNAFRKMIREKRKEQMLVSHSESEFRLMT